MAQAAPDLPSHSKNVFAASRLRAWDAGLLAGVPRRFGLPQAALFAGLIALALPPLFGLAHWTALIATLVVVGVLSVVLRRSPDHHVAFRLFSLALGLRLVLLVICYAVRSRYGVETVNPDATYYLGWAREIAHELPMAPDIRPQYRAGTYEVGFHYLVGWEIEILGDDVLALLSLNAAAGAGAVLVLYGLLKQSAEGLRILPAYLAALYPGLLYSSCGDLLKDPWVLLTMLAGLLLAFRALRAKPVFGALLSVAAGLCFFFLRVTRLYALFLTLLCLAVAAWYDLFRRRPRQPQARLPGWLLLACGVLAGVELPAVATRHPSLFAQSLGYLHMVREKPRVFYAPEGRIAARLGLKGSQPLRPVRLPGTRGVEEDLEDLRQEKPVRLGPLDVAINLVRKFYGPYLWVPPPPIPFSFIEGSFWDYIAMPIWYVLLPVGLLATVRAFDRKSDLVGIAAALGTCVTMALLAVFSLSYRQRSSVTLPFLLLVAGFSLLTVPRRALRIALQIQAVIILALASVYYFLLLR